MQTTTLTPAKKKREKTVFTGAELPHVWARKTQKTGRVAHNNWYFEGPIIYSYGSHFPIAKLTEKNGKQICLFTTRKYSNTTSAQTWATARAVSNIEKIYCAYPDASEYSGHKKNINAYINELEKNVSPLKASQRSFLKVKSEIQAINHALTSMHQYVEHFDLFSKTFEKSIWYEPNLEAWKEEKKEIKRWLKFSVTEIISAEKLEELSKKYQHLINTREERKEKARQERQKKLLELLPAWKAGEVPQHVISDLDKVYLRVKDNEVQTSHGARVSVPRAREVYKKWLSCVNCIEGEDLNGYKVRNATKDFIQIGCHHIEASEIKELATLLNW